MPRNISIKEVGVAQNISGVTHIVVPDIESSSLDYVPEEDIVRRFKVINSNGTYNPSEDLGGGYVALLVDVPVKSVKGKDKTTGKITTVSVNPETGEIEKTEQSSYPAGIHIVIPPTKKNYNDGDTIDFSGIHVYLVDQNNHQWTSSEYPTGEIPFNELVFPETTADGSTSPEDIYTNGSGINAYLFTSSTTPTEEGGSFYNVGTYGNVNYLISQPGVSFYMTRYLNGDMYIIYAMSANESSTGKSFSESYIIEGVGGMATAMGVSGTMVRKHRYNLLNDPDEPYFSWIPLSSSDPTGFSGKLTKSKVNQIPVQWSKDGGEVLEDTFEINVS